MDLSYPIGRFEYSGVSTPEQRAAYLSEIEALPANLRTAVAGLTEEQMDTPYRPGGWTVRQVVHHVPDSHVNSYIRFKLALTESEPVIKPYNEATWAELADSKNTPIDVSLTFTDMLHRRWMILLQSLTPEDFNKIFKHPELGPVSLDMAVALYAWHGRHHVAHITCLRERMGW